MHQKARTTTQAVHELARVERALAHEGERAALILDSVVALMESLETCRPEDRAGIEARIAEGNAAYRQAEKRMADGKRLLSKACEVAGKVASGDGNRELMDLIGRTPGLPS